MAGELEPFVARMIVRYLREGETMLDVGCGPATYRRSCPGRYIGVDITEKPYTPTLPREPDAVALAERLPFPAETFDLVMCKSALYLMSDAPGALAEFRRVLRPAGRLLVIDYTQRSQREQQRKHRQTYPCWTPRQLLHIVRASGFRNCQPLSTSGEMGAVERILRPPLQNLLGTWSIVLGLK